MGGSYVPPSMRRQMDGGPSESSGSNSAPAPTGDAPQKGGKGFHKGAKGGAWRGGKGHQGEDESQARGSRGDADESGWQDEAEAFEKKEQTTQQQRRTAGYGHHGRTTWGNADIDESQLEHLFRQNRHQQGLNFDKQQQIPVEVTGPEPQPDPLQDFAHSGLHPLLLDNIERYKYRNPTPIQKFSVPTMLTGHDVMACAQTGSGKTAAFLFPIIHTLLRNGPRPFKKRLSRQQVAPESLILAPTRELAMQIFEESQKFCFKTGLRSVATYGGMDMRTQIQDLDKGCQLLVATPGRLIDLCTPRQRKGSTSPPPSGGPPPKVSLSNIYVFCIDEADRMLDMGFDVQMRQIIKQRDMPPTEEIQTMMFSATFPTTIQRLAREFLTQPFYFIKVGTIGSTNTGITQTLEYCPESKKPEFLLALLHHAESRKLVLVFVDTKNAANELVRRLQEEGLSATSIHGDRTQQEREAALMSFKRGETPILVATDVASRGLDIPNVSHVVQYDLAGNLDDYTHRIGRTGRAGNTGVATAFFNEKNRGVGRSLLQYLHQHNQDVPQKLSEIVASAPVGKGGGKGGGKGRKGAEKEPDVAVPGLRTVSRKQILENKAAQEQSTYTAGNMLMSMMGAGGGQY